MQLSMFNESVRFVVRSGGGHIEYDPVRFSDEIRTVSRVPVQNAGWQSVRFQNRWYQLFGGVRTPMFICLDSPIRTAIRSG